MTTLNDAVEVELAQENKDESGSENFCIPTPLHIALTVYHASMVDDLSFNPVNLGQLPTSPEQHAAPSPCRHRCHNLTHCPWYSLSPMMKVLKDPVSDAAHLPVLIPEVQLQGSRCFIFSTL